MQIKQTIIKLDWKDVNKLLYALQAYSIFSLEYNKEFYREIKIGDIKGDNKSVEDMATDVVMNGGTIYIYDELSGGKPYRKKFEIIREDNFSRPYVQYPMVLEDFVEGFQNILDKKYDCEDKYREQVERSIKNFMEGGLLGNDLYTVLQLVLFNEIVYPI